MYKPTPLWTVNKKAKTELGQKSNKYQIFKHYIFKYRLIATMLVKTLKRIPTPN